MNALVRGSVGTVVALIHQTMLVDPSLDWWMTGRKNVTLWPCTFKNGMNLNKHIAPNKCNKGNN